MKHFLTGVIAALTLSVGSALAAPLAPSGTVGLSGTTTADPVHGGILSIVNDDLIGFQLDSTPSTLLAGAGGNLQNRVMKPGSGLLIFAPRIRDTFNDESVIVSITEIVISGFAGFDTDVEYRTDGLGNVGPNEASRSADGNDITLSYGVPIVIGFDVGQPQQTSFFPSIATNATEYALIGTATISGYVSDINGVQTGAFLSTTIDGVAVPVSPVPLPASALLLFAGLAGLGALRRST